MAITRTQLKQAGGRCFDVALGVFLIGVLVAVWQSSKTRADSATGGSTVKTKRIDSRGRATSAGVNMITAIQGTICIVDDGSRRQIQFDQTGSYAFTDCLGFTLSGVGTFSMRGSTTTLTDIRSDRRLQLNLDTSHNSAGAGLQFLSTQRTFTIQDRTTLNDVCGCP